MYLFHVQHLFHVFREVRKRIVAVKMSFSRITRI